MDALRPESWDYRRQQAGATSVLADWISGMRHAEVDPACAHRVRRLLLDHLTAAVAGAGTEVGRAVRRLVADMYPGDHATVIGGSGASAAGAALANGTAAHALDVDDGYTRGSVHPSAAVMPAVLATAQRTGADGATVVRALATGVEVTCRMARAAHPATRQAGFHNTAIAGVFGAAAGTAVVLGLERQAVASALGVAGSHAGGLFEFLGNGAEVKRLHAGKAARDGLLSAYLASAGVSGPATVLEGSNGYFQAFARGDWRRAELLDGLGCDWALRDVYTKVYPCCRHLHGAIDAVLDLRAAHGIDAGSVSEVRVATYSAAAAHAHTRCADLIDAQMSLPFAVAVALLDGGVGLEQFDGVHRGSTAVAALAGKVEIVADPALDARYPAERPARVTVHLPGRPALSAEVGQPRGEPADPLDDAELEAKFHRLAGPVLGARRAERVVDAVWTLGERGSRAAGLMAELGDDTALRGWGN